MKIAKRQRDGVEIDRLRAAAAMVEIWNVGGEWRCRARRTARNVVKLKSVDLAHAIAEADRVVGAHAVAGVGFAAAIVEAPGRPVFRLGTPAKWLADYAAPCRQALTRMLLRPFGNLRRAHEA